MIDRRALGDLMRRQDEINFHAEHLLSVTDCGSRGGLRRSVPPSHNGRSSNADGVPNGVTGDDAGLRTTDRHEQRQLAMDLLLVREQARYHGEWQATREELEFLVEASPAALAARLERDLSALSAAATSALAAIRSVTERGTDGAIDRAENWLPSAAAALRSALSIDLALEARRQLNLLQDD